MTETLKELSTLLENLLDDLEHLQYGQYKSAVNNPAYHIDNKMPSESEYNRLKTTLIEQRKIEIRHALSEILREVNNG